MNTFMKTMNKMGCRNMDKEHAFVIDFTGSGGGL
jgi:hypothetical protein